MGTSTTIPPSGTTSDPVSSLYLSDTFYTWYNNTNDLINKVNPIEVYTVRGITHSDINVTYQAGGTGDFEGVTLDDLGNGNWRIGYILPEKITGGHTWYQHADFKKGPSGHIANSFCGRTGEIVGANTVSGRYPEISGGTGNITGCVIEINNLLASAGGTISLTAGDIPGSLALAVGTAGFVLGSTVTGSPVAEPFRLFSGYHDALQDALHLRGVAGNTKGIGSPPRAVFGSSTIPAHPSVASSALVTVDSLGMSGASYDQHGIVIHQNLSKGYHIKSTGGFGLAASAGVYIDISSGAGTGDFVIKKSTSADSIYTSGTELFRIENDSTLHLENIIQDSANNTATGTSAGYFLISDTNSKMVWKDAPEGAWDYSTDYTTMPSGRLKLNNVPTHVLGSSNNHKLSLFWHKARGGGYNPSTYIKLQALDTSGDVDLYYDISNEGILYGNSSNNGSGTIYGNLFGHIELLVSPNGYNGDFEIKTGTGWGTLYYYIWS
jgi:hypothetical protein